MVMLKGNINISDDNIITTQDMVKKATEGIGPTIFKYMKLHKEKLSQIDAKTGQKDTFEELLQRCVRTAIHLTNKNVTRDDIVSLCSTNHSNSVVPLIAAQFIGAKVASLDPSLSPKEMSHLLKIVKPKILFVIPESVEAIEDVLKNLDLNTEIVVFGQTSKHTEFSEFIEHQENEENFEPVKIENLKDTAVIYFSSGTCGYPKGICVNHFAFVSQVYNSTHTDYPDVEYMKQQAPRVSFPLTYMIYTSSYWISAGTILLSSIIDGTCRLLCGSFDPKETWNLIDKYKPIFLALTPFQVAELTANGCPENIDTRCLLSFLIVGSAISKERLIKIRQIFPETDIFSCYGQTEVCGALVMFRGNDKFQRPLLQEKIDSVGLPVRGISYKVVDLETNKNLGPHQRGELRVKSEYVMNGYYNKDSSESFDEDGWLKTGDIVYYDEDFCFYVVDRIREAFKYQGWFIAPAMLENELMSHPDVKQAVVIGIPKEDGSHPMGLVVIKENSKVTEDEIEKFVENRVQERQKLRAGVKILKSIPLTVTGKVKRREIQQMVMENRL